MPDSSFENSVPHSGSYSSRSVTYLERPEYFGPKTGTIKTIRSTEINKIQNPQLRCALRIADVMQALDFPEPELGPVGCVTAIQKRTEGAFARFFTSEVTDAFPDDIMIQLSERGKSNDS